MSIQRPDTFTARDIPNLDRPIRAATDNDIPFKLNASNPAGMTFQRPQAFARFKRPNLDRLVATGRDHHTRASHKRCWRRR